MPQNVGMRVFTILPQDDLGKVAATAGDAEAAGYDGVATMENKHDPFLPLAVAAPVTQRIELATSIAIAFARSPMVAANIGWDLQRASGGRFNLGLGSQIRPHNERRFSVAWSAPAPRLREYVNALRAIWRCWRDGTKLDFRGEHYTFTLMTPAFTPPPIDTPPPVVTLAAVGPAMLRLAGEAYDGVRLHPFCTRLYLENVVLPEVQTGLARGKRGRTQFEISGGGFIATGADDAAVAQMVEQVRTRIGFYGSTPAYWPVLAEHGFEDLGQKLNALSKQGRWDDMTREVSDDLLHLMTAVGRYDQLSSAIQARFEGLSDSVTLASDPTLPPNLIQDIQRIPRRFKAFAA